MAGLPLSFSSLEAASSALRDSNPAVGHPWKSCPSEGRLINSQLYSRHFHLKFPRNRHPPCGPLLSRAGCEISSRQHRQVLKDAGAKGWGRILPGITGATRLRSGGPDLCVRAGPRRRCSKSGRLIWTTRCRLTGAQAAWGEELAASGVPIFCPPAGDPGSSGSSAILPGSLAANSRFPSRGPSWRGNQRILERIPGPSS